MLTDIRPVVERILRQLVVAGLPVVAAACGGGRTVLDDHGGVGSGGGAGAANIGGTGSGGDAGRGGMGGSGGGGGTGGALACQPLAVSCGTPPSCPSVPPGDAGLGFPLPLTTAILNFDPNDSRWAELYRACVASGDSAGCGPENCRGFCQAVVKASTAQGAFFITSSPYLKCDVTCGSPNQLTAVYTAAVCGRRFGSLGDRERSCSPGAILGRYLAEAAELEAESVPAFARLARALAAHDAPADLVRAARVATVEEARHWKRTRELARRHGGRPVKPPAARATFASLEDLAVDNVVEGCVRETYGAMVAAHQAAEAVDPDVRRLMTEIAVDELGHAALSWKIDAWACGRLGPGFQARRREAATTAAGELIAASGLPVADELQARAGLPAPVTARALLAATCALVWAPNLTEIPFVT